MIGNCILEDSVEGFGAIFRAGAICSSATNEDELVKDIFRPSVVKQDDTVRACYSHPPANLKSGIGRRNPYNLKRRVSISYSYRQTRMERV